MSWCVCVCASLGESEFLRLGSRAAAACEAVNSGHQSHQHIDQGRNPTSIHVTLQHIKHTLIHSSLLHSLLTALKLLFIPHSLQLLYCCPSSGTVANLSIPVTLTDSEISYLGFWFKSTSCNVSHCVLSKGINAKWAREYIKHSMMSKRETERERESTGSLWNKRNKPHSLWY